MKIRYEIEFDLPDDFQVRTFTSLLKLIRFGLLDRLPRSQVRFRTSLMQMKQAGDVGSLT